MVNVEQKPNLGKECIIDKIEKSLMHRHNDFMIGYISGQLKAIRKNYFIVVTAGLGYKVFVPHQLLTGTRLGEDIELYVFTYVREDQLTLYGFRSLVELDIYEMLISVSGIGPKVGLAIMSLGDMNAIKFGILNQDISVFTKISGVGKKTAQRMIIELKDKIVINEDDAPHGGIASSTHTDVMDVLTALGYSSQESKLAVSGLPAGLETAEQKIREALKSLAKK